MSKTKGKLMYVRRERARPSELIHFSDSPIKLYRDGCARALQAACRVQFEAFTGLKLRPGQQKRGYFSFTEVPERGGSRPKGVSLNGGTLAPTLLSPTSPKRAPKRGKGGV